MKELSNLHIPDDLRYAPSHEWVRLEGEMIVIGISDYAQDQLGDVVYVELPELGSIIAKDQEFGTVESVKAVSEIYMPIAGEVLMVNEQLTENPALVNEDPYSAGWFMKIKPSDRKEVDSLLSPQEYLVTLGSEE